MYTGRRIRRRGGQRPFKFSIPISLKTPTTGRKRWQNRRGLERLKHAHIARVYGIREEGGVLYQAAEWVSGESLAELLAHQAAMSLALAANLIEQAADGLAYAHRQGVVHGGLHPDTMLLKKTGGAYPWQVYLTNFRLAALLTGEPPRRLLPYMAPEQIKGRRDDGRSDIYALGVILYEALTGRLPYPAGPVAGQPPRPVCCAATCRPRWKPSSSKPSRQASLSATVQWKSSCTSYARKRPTCPITPPKPPPPPMVPLPLPTAAAPPPSNVAPGDEVIVIQHPQESTRYFGLKKWLITIGQMAGNDLVLTAAGVAAKHARLERAEGGWQVVDMGSQSGTFLENSRLLPDVPEIWREGQTLRIGPYTLEWGDELVTAVPIPEPIVAPPPVETSPAPPGLHLKLSPALVSTAPGSPVAILLELENQTDSLVTLNLRVEGIPAAWLAVEPAPIRLVAQQRIKVPAMIQPPRHSSATAGVHRYQIFAEPTYGAAETAVAQGQLSISPFSQFFAEIEPLPLRHQKPGRVTLHNEGNTPNQYTLSALDADQEIAFNLPQNSLALAPGQSDSIPITAAGRKRPFLVKQAIVPIEIHAQTNAAKLVEKGRVVIPPRISLALLALVFMPLLLVALLVGRWYLCQAPGDFIQAPFDRVCGSRTAVIAANTTPTPAAEATVVGNGRCR
ncbi:MAG: protein kinase [Chloroflexi bacterium]|nr:protein kinase [Chloroflexota bacterium]